MGFFHTKKKKAVDIAKPQKTPTNNKQRAAAVEQPQTVFKHPAAPTQIVRRPVNGELDTNSKNLTALQNKPQHKSSEARLQRLQSTEEVLLNTQKENAENKRNQDQLRLQVFELTRRLQDSNEEAARLQRSVTSLQDELSSVRSKSQDAARAAHAALRVKNEELRAKATELCAVNESHKQTILLLDQTCAKFANEQGKTHEALQVKDEELRATTRELDEMIESFRRARYRESEMLDELNEQRRKHAAMRAKDEELRLKTRELDAINESHDQAKLQLNQTRVELANEQRKARQATQGLADLNRQFEFVQQQCASLQEKLTSSLAQGAKRVTGRKSSRIIKPSPS